MHAQIIIEMSVDEQGSPLTLSAMMSSRNLQPHALGYLVGYSSRVTLRTASSIREQFERDGLGYHEEFCIGILAGMEQAESQDAKLAYRTGDPEGGKAS